MSMPQKKSLLSRLGSRFFNESNPMEYRISMIFFLVALFASILSATTNTLLNKGVWGVLFQWAFIALMIAFLFAPRHLQLRLFKPLVVLVCFIYVPFLFTQTAGYDGTALMFSLLGIFVLSVAFEKRTRAALIVVNALLLIALCFVEFFFPQWIVPHAGEQAKLVDQLVALVVTIFAMAALSIYIIDALQMGVRRNERLLGELEQKNRNLAEISHIFINLRHDDASVRKSMDMAGSFLGCDAMVFWEKDAYADRLTLRYAWHRDEADPSHPAEMKFSKGTLLHDDFLLRAKRFVIHGNAADARLSVPIHINDNLWGVVEFSHRQQSDWADSDIQLAIVLTSVFASYFERREYESSIERQLAQQSLTSLIAGRFIIIDELEKRVHDSIRDIGTFLGCDVVRIHDICGDPPTMLVLRYEWTSAPLYRGQDMIRYTDEMGEAFRQRAKPYLMDTRNADIGVASTLLVPFYMGTTFSGVLSFLFHQPHHWLDNEIQLSLMFGATYSVVMARNLQAKHLMEAKTRAEAASKAKSEFLSNTSHEIRTPMNAIIGMTEIGLATTDAAKSKECLSGIRTASNQLLSIINDILDISKIETGKLVLEAVPFDFPAMVGTVESLIREQAERKNLRFTTRLAAGLRNRYIGDGMRIAQILTNLLSNAVKFTPEGGSVRLDAEPLETRDGKTVIRVSVADSGVGIAHDQIDRIFNSFEQADNSVTRRYGGTGLGLAISKNLVEAMGGSIFVVSQPGEGSTFSFEISLQPAPDSEEGNDVQGSQQSETSDPATPPDFSNLTILLAEDNEINRMVFEELLSETGIHIDSASNGSEALQAFSDAPDRYDLIFMDIQMPVMDGLEATRSIRMLPGERAKTIPIVAMTANVFQEDIQRSLAAGMNDHLGKPIDVRKVFEKIVQYAGANGKTV